MGKRLIYKNENCFSELEVHIEAFNRLKEAFQFVRAHYEVYDKKTYETGIFDIAILDKNKNIILVIEVKKNNKVKKRTRQIEKYKRLVNCPCVYIVGMDDAKNCVSKIKELLNV